MAVNAMLRLMSKPLVNDPPAVANAVDPVSVTFYTYETDWYVEDYTLPGTTTSYELYVTKMLSPGIKPFTSKFFRIGQIQGSLADINIYNAWVFRFGEPVYGYYVELKLVARNVSWPYPTYTYFRRSLIQPY
jgi:hypothetical protein